MTISRLALGAVMLVGVAGAAGAQVGQPIPRADSVRVERRDDRAMRERGMRRGEQKGNRHGKRGDILRDLNLTEAQRTQIRAIHERNRQQMEAKHREQMSEIRNILTPEQRVKFDAAAAKRKQGMEGRREGKPRR